MDLYIFSLALGGAGLGVMALSGLGAHAGHGHAGQAGAHGALHGHGGHGAGHVTGHAASHGAGHGGFLAGLRGGRAGRGAAARGAGASSGGAVARAFWALTSPRVLFSMLVGFGAAGLLARPLGEPLALARAVAGGLAFERFLVGPLWNQLFRFASEPARTLEHAIMEEARATSGFDANGQGLVAVEYDGQVVQLLATLLPEDRGAGIRVRAGDLVRIEDVDDARNRCTVRYLGHG